MHPNPTNPIAALNALPPSTFLATFFPLSTLTASVIPPECHLRLRSSQEMSRAELTACFELVRDTSAKDYRASAQGWDAGAKEREMRLVDLRYLLLCRAMNKEGDGGKGEGPGEEVLVGFMSFMLTYEDGLPVVYCYEIHLRDEVKGRGVGKWLMGVLEDVGRKAEAEKCMLTVFKRNTKALGFYQGLGYGVDEFSPGPRILRNGVVKEVDYLILSKELASARTGLKGAGEKQWKVG